jgi:acylphosphatase
MILHYSITVTGRVQGVGFRYAAFHVARQLGLTGYVRNNPDGTVYMEVEGSEDKLEEYRHWCHSGPSAARVEEVLCEGGALEHYPVFTIR